MIQLKVFGSANFGAKIQILEKVIFLARKLKCDNFNDAVFFQLIFAQKFNQDNFDDSKFFV